MSRVERYLTIPYVYGQWLGELAWSADLEAIEYRSEGNEVGCTFAVAEEISLFLEGFLTQQELIAFGFVLHILHRLGLGIKTPFLQEKHQELEVIREFRAQGRPVRNAGALFAYLTREIPRATDPPSSVELFVELKQRRALGGTARPFRGKPSQAEVPPLEPPAFDSWLLATLAKLTPDQVRHWLKHGCDSIADVDESKVPTFPPSLSAAFDSLHQYPRLTPALSLAESVEGMLTLPPRAQQGVHIPAGGYTDLSTRGLPERIVPTQLALDPDEFVRRFAENELLYFERETPKKPESHDLVILLDQGVRTWGIVRLILSATLITMGRRADRAKIAFRIVVTSGEFTLIDPLQLKAESLAQHLEASDLSFDPGRRLGLVLESVSDRTCDVVLLTHPRSLLSSEVAAAAQRADEKTRLFAVAANDEGYLTLSEFHRGIPLPRTRCRVSLSRAEASNPALADRFPDALSQWQGTVEFPGFPFLATTTLGPVTDRLFDLDLAGNQLLIAQKNGFICCWKCEGTELEILPRVLFRGRPLTSLSAVMGVLGGFVIAGHQGRESLLVHYDFRRRNVNLHALGNLPLPQMTWSYLSDFHTVIVREHLAPRFAIDLGAPLATAKFAPGPNAAEASSRAKQAWTQLSRMGQNSPTRANDELWASASYPIPESLPDEPILALNSKTGTITITNRQGSLESYCPMREGSPLLVQCSILFLRSSESVFGAIMGNSYKRILILFSKKKLFSSDRELSPVLQVPLRTDCATFSLQRGGRRVAWRTGKNSVEVRDLWADTRPSFLTLESKTRIPSLVILGNQILLIKVYSQYYIVRWDKHILEVFKDKEAAKKGIAEILSGSPRKGVQAKPRSDRLPYDKTRFPFGCTFGNLAALIDIMGQICLFNQTGQFLCMFCITRSSFSAWLYDGTTLDVESSITGEAATNARKRIGEELARASLQAMGTET